MVGLQEEMARKAKIAEKELQMAQVSSSGGSSFRSISPVVTPGDNLTKVSGWMDKTEETENVASVYQQTSVSAPVITVRSTHGGHCSAQVRDLKSSLKPVMSTETQVFGEDGTKTVIGAKSNNATRSEVRLIEAVDDPQYRPESVTTYVWRHPEWCISSPTACEHTEAVFAKSRAKHGVERER